MKTTGFFLSTLFSLIGIYSQAQVLHDINYSYLYNPLESFSFVIKPIRQTEGWTVFYKLQLLDSAYSTDEFSILWEKRVGFGDKEGTPLSALANLSVMSSNKEKLIGKLNIGVSEKPQVLVAKVVNNTKKEMWLFFKILEPNYTVNGYLQSADGQLIFDSYINVNAPVSVHGFNDGQLLTVSYYNDNFPAAAPAFSEGQARVNQVIKPDSVFSITSAQPLAFDKKGLYLVQKDTATIEGISFRVEDDYPKFKRLQDLVGPFVYVCAKDEFDRLRLSGNDKKQFDKGVLAITRDADRARQFMKNYFRRAETANHYFTSYKEGWKTDRGMIYLIYGQPKTVFRFSDREVWSYGKTDFNFIKSSTLFDPENYVLIRNKKFIQEWYEKVDLLRNSRF